MKTQSLGFLGGGRITKIFLQVIKNNKSEYKSIVVYDIQPDAVLNLKSKYPEIEIAESPDQAASQDIVFIALHPPVIIETLELVKHNIKSGTMVISLAPKISLAKLASSLPDIPNLARLIPNATSIVNEGYNPITFASTFADHKKQSLLRLLRRMGHTFEVEEGKLEGYAILSAMLPTYFWFQWKELIRIGAQMGLTEEESLNSVRDTLLAAIRTYFYSGMNADEVMDLIPVKPISEHEEQIKSAFSEKLLPLFSKIKP